MELYDLAKEEVDDVLFPVVGWVALLSVLSLLAGGICLGFYIRNRYYIELNFFLYIALKLN